MISEIKSSDTFNHGELYLDGQRNLLAQSLFTAATKRVRGSFSLDRIIQKDDHLAGARFMYISYSDQMHGEVELVSDFLGKNEIVKITWISKDELKRPNIDVRVVNPSLETFMSIPQADLALMRLEFGGGVYRLGRDFLKSLGVPGY